MKSRIEIIKEQILDLLKNNDFLREHEISDKITDINKDLFKFLADQWEYLQALDDLVNEGLIEQCYCLIKKIE